MPTTPPHPSAPGEALLPCPFCGSEDVAYNSVRYSTPHELRDGTTQYEFYGMNCVRCQSAMRGVIGFATKELAAKAWNRRAALTPPTPTE